MRAHTRLVQFDPAPGDPHSPLATPIYQTATFEQDEALVPGRYDYSRSGNPTRTVLESQLAALEGGSRGFAFASGMAALSAVLRLVPAGGHVVAGDDLYGGTWRLLYQVAPALGIATTLADVTRPDEIARAIRPNTALVLVETPTNPLLRVADLAALADVARRGGARLVVDNTALSPWLQRPLALGADAVVHSATKLLCGHSDVSAGAVVVADPELERRIAFVQNAEGAALGPFDAFLLLRGMKTLGVRLERQQATAGRIAAWLAERLDDVYYPGLPDHPGRDVLLRQATGAGCVVAFRTGSLGRSAEIIDRSRLFATAVSFGSVHSTACLPCTMSHASIDPSPRRLPEDVVRLSVGLEEAEDLLDDLAQATRMA
jgi:cystathionine beta-lyase